ncbi:MAG: AMP-binding protein [Verrucomicrobiota bacterium]
MSRAKKPSGKRFGYYPGDSPLNNVVSYIEAHAGAFPQRVALRWADPAALRAWNGDLSVRLPVQDITYERFVAGIRSAAGGLSGLGIGKGDRVIIFLPMSVLMYTAMFAVQRLGAIAVFLDSWARRDQLGASAACVAPKAMISHKAAFELIRDVPEFAGMKQRIIAGPSDGGPFSARLEQWIELGGEAPIAAVASEFTALITFTTGSSGTPKGANRTHRFLAAQHEALAAALPYRDDDLDLPVFPIFSLNNLASGVTTILPAIDLASPSDRDPAALVGQIQHERVTCATLSPSLFRNVARLCLERGLTLPSLRRVVTGGAPVSRDNVSDFRKVAPKAEIWVLYGSTEVEPMAHIEAREMLGLAPNPDPEIVEEGVNVGRISEGLRYKFIRIVRGPIDLKVTPWDRLEVKPGEVGEFVVTGDHVCRDYYNNPGAFQKSKILDAKGIVWHRTGDLARLDDQGYLWMVGRVHNVIERRGRYVFPVRAEVVLKKLPFIRQGAYLGITDPRLGERTAVVVELPAGAPAPDQVLREIQRLFDKNGIPVDSFYVADEIPMDPRHHSKVEYDVLRKDILERGGRDYLRYKG